MQRLKIELKYYVKVDQDLQRCLCVYIKLAAQDALTVTSLCVGTARFATPDVTLRHVSASRHSITQSKHIRCVILNLKAAQQPSGDLASKQAAGACNRSVRRFHEAKLRYWPAL